MSFRPMKRKYACISTYVLLVRIFLKKLFIDITTPRHLRVRNIIQKVVFKVPVLVFFLKCRYVEIRVITLV